MVGQIQLTFLLAIVVCIVHSAPFTDNQNHSVQHEETWRGIDKAIDTLLPSTRKFILKEGMDPMRIVNCSEYIFPFMPGELKGNIYLYKGWMQNLSLMKRTKHASAIHKDKRLTLDVNLGFDVLDFSYQYYLTYLLYNRKGDLYGRLYKPEINVVTTIDLNKHHLILDSIKFTNIWKVDIKFEGHLLDRIINAVTKIITMAFENHVLKVIENNAMLDFHAIFDDWNTMTPQSDRMEIINRSLDIMNIQD
ncbi:PREDICTED: uncharacterized protein LOC105562896 [Vollenhovia emeryi]|uniref:uncharacterized protein LOC105562896 n=1 Tax=Vollenhovia emeryi TaxID=411798 RepID=UPI0005F392AF|nr:PREDICTED: uncharacterized protein LOC105562896 [Vollenhovia emeryi]